MRIWWVSHNKTYEAEVGGGYLWSPKTNADGSYSRSYDNMTVAARGDLVLSFAGSQIRAVGLVQGWAYTAARPPEFGKAGRSWSDEGWLVPTTFTLLVKPFRPADEMERLRPLLPQSNSPLQVSGRGNQAYLFDVTGSLGEALLQIAGRNIEAGVTDDAEERTIQSRTDIAATEKIQLVRARIGQGIYRTNLERLEQKCRLTGISDRRFLVASHIKPWRSSSDDEKLDGNNGLLLAPHVDRLFDRGFISFQKDGTMLIRHDLPRDLLPAWGLGTVRNVGPFGSAQSAYLEYHRLVIFGQES